MKRSIVKIAALALAALVILMAPLAVLATTYSGVYNGINYTAHVGGEASFISSDITVSTSSNLKIRMYPEVKYYDGTDWITKNDITVPGGAGNATYVSVTKLYSEISAAAHISSIGYFVQCNYTTKINGHAVVNNANEVF